AAGGDLLHQPREVVRTARRRQRPYVLELEVGRELVYPPRPGGVRGVRQPHASTSIHTVVYGWSLGMISGGVNAPPDAIQIGNGPTDPHAPQQMDRGRAAGPSRRRPGRRPDRTAGPSARRHQGRLLLALRGPAR